MKEWQISFQTYSLKPPTELQWDGVGRRHVLVTHCCCNELLQTCYRSTGLLSWRSGGQKSEMDFTRLKSRGRQTDSFWVLQGGICFLPFPAPRTWAPWTSTLPSDSLPLLPPSFTYEDSCAYRFTNPGNPECAFTSRSWMLSCLQSPVCYIR